MNKKWILLTILICCLANYCVGRETTSEEKKNDKETSAIDVAARSVLYLEFDQVFSKLKEHKGKEVECDLFYVRPDLKIYEPMRETWFGTGFLAKTKKLNYVVTAKHVVKNNKSLGRYWISDIDGGIVNGTFKEVRKRIKGSKWFFHEYADVAIHPVDFGVKGKFFRVIPVEKIFREPTELLTPVCVPGFPHQLGKDNINLGPLIETCDVVSWPAVLSNRYPQSKVIFLSKRLAVGYSGAPVFSLGEPPSRSPLSAHTMNLVGIQSKRFVWPEKVVGKKETAIITDELSIIVPVSYLLEVFESKEVEEFEKELHNPQIQIQTKEKEQVEIESEKIRKD